MASSKGRKQDSTLSALLKEKPKRGRPKHKTPRKSVYVALSTEQKAELSQLAKQLPDGMGRADVPNLAIVTLSVRLAKVRRAVADRDRELPEGINHLDSLYYLWDLQVPDESAETKWTSVRLSPQQAVEFGRLQGTFKALFGANRSQVFSLALSLLSSTLGLVSTQAFNSISTFETQLIENKL